jgi:hypothetical protein
MVSLRLSRRRQRSRQHRVSDVRSVKYSGAFFFGGNVAIEQPDAAIEIADHLSELYRLLLVGFARIKMTLVFHCNAPKMIRLHCDQREPMDFGKESQEPCQRVGREDFGSQL